ncbi:MAG: hypothetical protein JW819_03330 [Candidatus Krumholzibacteriota bacterium]|nr:hypothetical protein [Candidatus Krumholzibacteriota bacterium]
MKQYCSVCKAYFDMEVVEEGSGDEVTWLRCPRCKGILPYMKLEEEPDAEPAAEAEFSLDSIDQDAVQEYDSKRQYEVGDVLYHRSWNDYGRVVEKLILPGNRQAIRVRFLNQGDVNLLEAVREKV